MEDKLNDLLNMVRKGAGSVVDSVNSMTGDAVKNVGKTAEDFANIAKINMEIFDLNTEIAGLMRTVGEIVYATHKGEESDGAVLMQNIGLIDAKKGKVEYLKAQADAIRGAKVCPSCGARCDNSDKFCNSCGAKL